MTLRLASFSGTFLKSRILSLRHVTQNTQCRSHILSKCVNNQSLVMGPLLSEQCSSGRFSMKQLLIYSRHLCDSKKNHTGVQTSVPGSQPTVPHLVDHNKKRDLVSS